MTSIRVLDGSNEQTGKPGGTGKVLLRSERANTLVFITALTLALLLAVTFFSLRYTRSLKSNKQGATAIESAALLAASDLARVVVKDETFGYISLCDQPRGGKATMARDNYYLPVKGINTILATIRLDLIIADQVGDKTMRQLAQADLEAALKTKDILNAALNDAISPGGGSARDADGNVVCVLDDVRRVLEVPKDSPATIEPDSIKVSLGCVRGIQTGTSIPNPRSYAQLTNLQFKDKRYRAYINVPYAGKDFIFAGVGSNNTLLDPARFRSDMPKLPYIIPCIVLIEAEQEQTHSQSKSRMIRVRACAQPGSAEELSPARGTLTITMPDGQLAEFSEPADFTSNRQMANLEACIASPSKGDFPTAPLKKLDSQALGLDAAASMKSACSLALYDWLKRAGPVANVQSFVDMQNSPIAPGLEPVQATITSYDFIRSGTQRGSIHYSVGTATQPYTATSDQQVLAVSASEFNAASGTAFDIVVSDNCALTGAYNSGIHGGEPILDERSKFNQSLDVGANIAQAIGKKAPLYCFDFGKGGCGATIVGPPSRGWDGESGGWAYGQWKLLGAGGVHGGSNKECLPALPPTGPAGGAARDMNDRDLVADIALHRVINSDAQDE